LGRSGVREHTARLSRDGRLIAFESDESGATEIYVAPFGTPRRRRVSSAGGTQPHWKADGRELFFATTTGDVMSAAVNGSDPLDIAPPVRLFQACAGSPAARSLATAALEWFDAAADGTRFLIACGAEDATSPIVVSVDWTASLK
jgi:eukaryotic-like serine/threonine-protein kinase